MRFEGSGVSLRGTVASIMGLSMESCWPIREP